MLGKLWDFLKRHRRKLFFGGFLAGGGYILYKYAEKKFKEIQEKEAAECLAHARRQHHFDSNQRTCNMTVLSMLPNLRETLIKLYDTEKITEDLKDGPSNKMDLWEKLKIMSVTRAVCVVYGCSIISLVLRVQLNVIGGYMYLDNILNRNGASKEMAVAPPHVQERYLSTIKYFLEKGIKELSVLVQAAVERELGSYSLKEKLTLQNIEAIIEQIRHRIESSPEISDLTSPTVILCKYMLPPETSLDHVNDTPSEQMYQRLLSETRDVLETDDFHSVLKSCIDKGYSKLLDSLADHYKHQLTDSQQHFHEIDIPLAKIVPVINGLLFKLCSDAPNPLIQELLLLEPTKTLAANVYEAFSQKDDIDDASEQTPQLQRF